MKNVFKRVCIMLCTFVLVAQLLPAAALAQERYGVERWASIKQLLAQGDYIEGEAIAVVRVGAQDALPGETDELAEVASDSVELAVKGAQNTESAVDDEAALRLQSSDTDEFSIVHVVDHSRTTEQILNDLLDDPNVITAEPNYVIAVAATQNDTAPSLTAGSSTDFAIGAAQTPEYGNGAGDLTNMQWYLSGDTTYRTPDSPTAGYSLNVPGWNGSDPNASGTVCVVDTGLDTSHPDLQQALFTFSAEQQVKYGCGPHGRNFAGDHPIHSRDSQGWFQ